MATMAMDNDVRIAYEIIKLTDIKRACTCLVPNVAKRTDLIIIFRLVLINLS